MVVIHLQILEILCIAGVLQVFGSQAEYRLIKDLLDQYDVNVRPAKNTNDTVHMYLDLAVNQILDVDERSQVLTLKCWFRQHWYDYQLAWNTSEYDGIDTIRLFGNRIWKPDITLYNDVIEEHEDRSEFYPADIHPEGHVRYNVPYLIKTYCRLNVRYFPYDVQTCELKFGSWTYDKSALDIHIWENNSSGDMSVFEHNGEWELVKIPAMRREVKYSCKGCTFPDVTFWIVLQRRPLYYIFNLILPCIFITATTCLVFYLPPESGEKVSLAVTVLLATTVFLLLVAESMPPQSDCVPLIAQYFASVIILMAIATSLTVIVMNLHHRGAKGEKVPKWIRLIIFDFLAYIVCMRGIVKHMATSDEEQIEPKPANGSQKNYLVQIENNVEDSNKQTVTDLLESRPPDLTRSEILLEEIVQLLREAKKCRKEKKKENRLQEDWMVVAMVVDRFLLVIFLVLTIVVTMALLINKPVAEEFQLPEPYAIN